MDEKCSTLARENTELKSHIEEDAEEMNVLLQKNKNLVALVSIKNKNCSSYIDI